MGSESSYHRGLKKIAKEVLKNEGYFPVEEEYPVRIGNKSFRVDVVGFKNRHKEGEKKKAFECGDVSLSKLKKLEEVFDEVKHIGLQDIFDFFEGKIPKPEKVEMYKRAYLRVKKKYRRLRRKWDRLSSFTTNHKKKKTKLLQIRCTHQIQKAFKKFVVNNEFENYEKALKDLLELADQRREIIDSYTGIYRKYDISVVSKDGVVCKDNS